MVAVADVPAAMVNNQFFEEFTEKVRQKPIPWEGYSRAGLISSEELQQLKAFQKQLAEKQEPGTEQQQQSLAGHVGLVVSLTEKLSSIDALQYLLVVLDDVVELDAGAVRELGQGILEGGAVERALFRCMEKRDDYLGLKASKILVGIAVSCSEEQFAFGRMFGFLEKCMRSELTSVVDVALQVVQSALRVARARKVLYAEAPGCLSQMVDVLKRTVSRTQAAAGGRGVVAVSQTQYEVVFCLWLLTFGRSEAVTLDRRYDVVPTLVEIARGAVKEKVVRVIVATWANMAQHAAAIPGLLVARVPACLETLRVGRNFKDEDLKQMVAELSEVLGEHSGVMTSWDEYKNQLKSGRLEWSGWHRSEQFWKMHAAKMDEQDHQIVRQLAKVLGDPESTATSQAVACHDLSQYVKCNPEGKRFVSRIGAKQRVMELMTTSDSAEVKYEALMCVQQMMLNAWRN
ncbi:H(+)-transporting V1 sector ATPase subunit H [Coemansia sp. RSA 1086]|nr:H(+)-transporting V1 sector ATPase subunit H [Coemansia sp. RSA 1086]